MLKIALTGNIASGKSCAENFLEQEGYSVLDSDKVAHRLLEEETVIKEIKQAFAETEIIEQNKISRAKLSQIVFNDDSKKELLEKILHPKIKNEILNFFSLKEKSGAKAVFVSVPLLYEANFETLFDKVILICADENMRLERLIKRNNLSAEDAKKRMSKQISQDEKTSLADFVVYNNKSKEEFLILLSDVVKKCLFGLS